MNRYRPTDAEPIDPDLLLVAAHELGHAIVDRAQGVTVTSIRVDRRAYVGLTTVELDDTSSEQLRGALIGSTAGFVAELLWCHRHGGTAQRGCSASDFRNFARNRRRVGLTEAVARAHARSTVIRYWPLVERWAPVLAVRGVIAPDFH